MKKKSLLSKLIVSGYILSTIAPTLTSVNQVSAETADVEVTEEDIISLLNEFVARLSEGTDNEFSELTTENLDQEQLIRIVDGLHNHKEEDFEEAAEDYTPLLEQEINNNVAAIVEYFLHLAENRDAFGTEEAEQIEQLEELVAALSTEEAEVEEAGEDEDEQEETEEEVEVDEESESEEEAETEDSEVAESSEEVEESTEEEIEETSEVGEAAEIALYNQAASDLTADEHYTNVMEAGTASSAWNAAQEFIEAYPEDERLSEAVNDAATRVLALGQNHHRNGNFSQATTQYNRLVNEPLVNEEIRNAAATLLERATAEESLGYAATYYNNTINANSATAAWNAGQEFKSLYPNDSRLEEAINSAANRMFSMGQSSHRSGNFSNALFYYNRIINEPLVDSSLRSEAEIYRTQAEAGNSLVSSSDYYKSVINANSATEAWNAGQDFKEAFPNDIRLEEAINSAADRMFSMGQSSHRSRNFSNALFYYNRIANESLVRSSLRTEVAELTELAEDGIRLMTENEFYNAVSNANTASEAWDIAVEGLEVYPNSSRVNDAVNLAADRVLALGQSNHRDGNFSTALTYYNRVANESAVRSSLRESANQLIELAEAGNRLQTVASYYNSSVNASTATEAWNVALEGLEFYPNNDRVLNALDAAAQRQFSMGQSNHRSGNYNTALTYYNRVVNESRVSSDIRDVVNIFRAQAHAGTPLRTANDYVNLTRNANTASEAWDIAVEGTIAYPNNSNTQTAIDEAAQRLLRLGRSNHRSGNISTARTYFNRVINESTVSEPIRVLASSYERLTDANYRPVVFVDAGHGGSDPGAVHGGVTEASLNISTSRLLRDELNVRGYEVVMIRNLDQFIELADRAQNANDNGADLFLSIHYNSMGGSGTARGIETFIFHRRPQGGLYQETNRNNFNTADPRIDDSLRLADATHNRLIQQTGMNDRGVKGDNFHVVRETYIPSVLFELGFMDNPTELARIRQTSYQQTAARAIADGIDAYFGR